MVKLYGDRRKKGDGHWRRELKRQSLHLIVGRFPRPNDHPTTKLPDWPPKSGPNRRWLACRHRAKSHARFACAAACQTTGSVEQNERVDVSSPVVCMGCYEYKHEPRHYILNIFFQYFSFSLFLLLVWDFVHCTLKAKHDNNKRKSRIFPHIPVTRSCLCHMIPGPSSRSPPLPLQKTPSVFSNYLNMLYNINLPSCYTSTFLYKSSAKAIISIA